MESEDVSGGKTGGWVENGKDEKSMTAVEEKGWMPLTEKK